MGNNRPDAQAKAREYLGYLRAIPRHYELYTMKVREELTDSGLTLADIGTSEAELNDLWVKGCKFVAGEYLELLRKGSDDYRSFISYVLREAVHGGLTLADFGTSQAELEDLRVLGCKTLAGKYLELLRAGSDHFESFINHLRREVKEGGFSLADIGTNEDELASFGKPAA